MNETDIVVESYDVGFGECGLRGHVCFGGFEGSENVFGEADGIELGKICSVACEGHRDFQGKADLEVCLEQEVCCVVEAPFPRLLERCSGVASARK